MKITNTIIAYLAAVGSADASLRGLQQCAAAGEQCGGLGFKGPSCCEAGSTCEKQSVWKFECSRQGSASSPDAPPADVPDRGSGNSGTKPNALATLFANRGPAGSGGGGGAILGGGQGTKKRNVKITFYGASDNDADDKGDYGAISPEGQKVRGRTDATSTFSSPDAGTFDNPITLAADPDTPGMPYGTKVYIPFVKRYYIFEDWCEQCVADSPRLHVDLFIGPNSWDGEDQSQLDQTNDCESALTPDDDTNSYEIILNPPAGLPLQNDPLTPFLSYSDGNGWQCCKDCEFPSSSSRMLMTRKLSSLFPSLD